MNHSLPPSLPMTLGADLAERVKSRIGLVFEGARAFAFDAAIHRACEDIGCTPHELLASIDADQPVWPALIEALTVGESYFFRDALHFEPFIAHLRQHRRARVWSVGCAAGEEPHSLAILALEVLGRAAPGPVQIWASDLNASSLARAEAGRYRQRALRGVTPSIIARYFTPEGSEWVLEPRVRELVSFSPVNLLARTIAWPGGLDFIYCRNVLIYFSMGDVQRVLAELSTRLAPGGRLVLGPSDPYPEGLPLTRSRDCGFTSWIAEGSKPPPSLEQPVATPPPPPSRRAPPASTPSSSPRAAGRSSSPDARRHGAQTTATRTARPEGRDRRDAGEPRPPVGPADAETVSDQCAQARSLADRGATDQAWAILAEAIEHQPMSASPYLLRAVLEQHRGHHGAALRDARRALLLDPSLVYAQVVRAASEVALGRHEAARRSLRCARRLLQQLPTDAVVPESGQMHRTEVSSICRSLEAIVTRELR